jgi:nitroreductase
MGKDRIFRGGQAAILVHADSTSAVSADNCHYALFHIILLAHAMGLGSCLLQTFVLAAEKDPKIKEALRVPEDQTIFGCVTLGYPKYTFYKIPARNEAKVQWI